MNRIGIYCGSFDPVHKGHIAIARACVEQDLVDEVWIIATGAYWDKNDLTPFSERIAMLKMAAKEGIVIDETYNELPYTYQIFEQLEKDHPDKRFSLILGGDNLPRFDQWRNYEYLLNFDFIVLPRGEVDEKEVIFKLMEKKHFCAKEASEQEKNKMCAYLLRKGFRYDDIRQLIQVSSWNA